MYQRLHTMQVLRIQHIKMELYRNHGGKTRDNSLHQLHLTIVVKRQHFDEAHSQLRVSRRDISLQLRKNYRKTLPNIVPLANGTMPLQTCRVPELQHCASLLQSLVAVCSNAFPMHDITCSETAIRCVKCIFLHAIFLLSTYQMPKRGQYLDSTTVAESHIKAIAIPLKKQLKCKFNSKSCLSLISQPLEIFVYMLLIFQHKIFTMM